MLESVAKKLKLRFSANFTNPKDLKFRNTGSLHFPTGLRISSIGMRSVSPRRNLHVSSPELVPIPSPKPNISSFKRVYVDGIIQGTTTVVIKGDTRSSDHG